MAMKTKCRAIVASAGGAAASAASAASGAAAAAAAGSRKKLSRLEPIKELNGVLATDCIIPFGEYKGRSLGSLPSGYLGYISTNLRYRDEQIAGLAEGVLHLRRDYRSAHFQFKYRIIRAVDRSLKRSSPSSALSEIDRQNVTDPDLIYGSLLRRCGQHKSLEEGRRVHKHIAENNLMVNRYLANLVVHMYAKCGQFLDAKLVFDGIESKNDRTYAIMIAACVKENRPVEALELWREMEEEGVVADKYIVTSLVAACTKLQALDEGRRLHEHLIITGFRMDAALETALLQMYAKCGSLDDAKRVFEGMYIKDLFAWSSIISAYARSGRGEMALVLYRRMIAEGVEPNVVTYACALAGCASVGGLADGRDIHKRILASKVPQDDVLQDSLLNMYLKCDEIVEARKVFKGMKARNVRSYTAMISAYVQAGEHQKALKLFSRMSKVEEIEPNAYTFATILGAAEGIGDLDRGRKIHRHLESRGFEANVVVQNALVTMYGKCGSPEEARKVFDAMKERNVISWTSMIAAYAQHGDPHEALQLFKKMDVEPSGVSFSSALYACAMLGTLDEGRAIHQRITEANLTSPQMETSLLSMYARCGSLDDARRVFSRMKTRDAFSCNAMIAAFTHHGRKNHALRIYRKMEQEGISADGVTFVSVLVACSHASLVADCREFFQSLVMDYDLRPSVEHYLCMLDVLGRSGMLEDAEELLETMPFQADGVAWMSLLAGCKRHGDVDRGERAARKVFELAPAETIPYVFLSNMYAAARRFDDARRIRKEMEERGVGKPETVSYIELDGEVHKFVSGGGGGDDGEMLGKVRSLLLELLEPMKQAGYVPDTREVYLEQQQSGGDSGGGGGGEAEKKRSLCFHSERLAIAYGLINSDDSRAIRVVNNSHRMCSDCHAAIKVLSDITDRTIVLRDGSRFHHFENGACSCGGHF